MTESFKDIFLLRHIFYTINKTFLYILQHQAHKASGREVFWSSHAVDPFKFKDNFSTNRSWKLHKYLTAFEKLDPYLQSMGAPQILNYLTWLKDPASPYHRCWHLCMSASLQCPNAGILTVSVLPSLCISVSTCFELSIFSRASRAEPWIFHVPTSWGKQFLGDRALEWGLVLLFILQVTPKWICGPLHQLQGGVLTLPSASFTQESGQWLQVTSPQF